MTRTPYKFGVDGQLASIKQHSIAKHQYCKPIYWSTSARW